MIEYKKFVVIFAVLLTILTILICMLYQCSFYENTSIIENMGNLPEKFDNLYNQYKLTVKMVKKLINKRNKKRREFNSIKPQRNLTLRQFRNNRNHRNIVTRNCNNQRNKYIKDRKEKLKKMRNLRRNRSIRPNRMRRQVRHLRKLINREKIRWINTCRNNRDANNIFHASRQKFININRIFYNRRNQVHRLNNQIRRTSRTRNNLKKEYENIFRKAREQCINNSNTTDNNRTINNMKECESVYDYTLGIIAKEVGTPENLISMR